jgi:hypothetical protein
MAHIVSIIIKGGIVMIPLLACSLISLALTIERIMFWTKLNSIDVLQQILALVENSEFEQALKLGKTSSQPIARVLAAGIAHRNPAARHLSHRGNFGGARTDARGIYRDVLLDGTRTEKSINALAFTISTEQDAECSGCRSFAPLRLRQPAGACCRRRRRNKMPPLQASRDRAGRCQGVSENKHVSRLQNSSTEHPSGQRS